MLDGLDDDLLYVIRNNKVIGFGQLYVNPTEESASLNVNHTTIRFTNNNKIYAFYGECDINCSQWNNWTDKSFKNTEIKQIQTGNYHQIEITIKTKQKLNFFDDVHVDKLAEDIYKLTVNKVAIFNLPECEILHFSSKQIHEKEYFIFPDLSHEITINKNKYSLKIIIITIIILIIVSVLFSFLYVFLRKKIFHTGSSSPKIIS